MPLTLPLFPKNQFHRTNWKRWMITRTRKNENYEFPPIWRVRVAINHIFEKKKKRTAARQIWSGKIKIIRNLKKSLSLGGRGTGDAQSADSHSSHSRSQFRRSLRQHFAIRSFRERLSVIHAKYRQDAHGTAQFPKNLLAPWNRKSMLKRVRSTDNRRQCAQ